MSGSRSSDISDISRESDNLNKIPPNPYEWQSIFQGPLKSRENYFNEDIMSILKNKNKKKEASFRKAGFILDKSSNHVIGFNFGLIDSTTHLISIGNESKKPERRMLYFSLALKTCSDKKIKIFILEKLAQIYQSHSHFQYYLYCCYEIASLLKNNNLRKEDFHEVIQHEIVSIFYDHFKFIEQSSQLKDILFVVDEMTGKKITEKQIERIKKIIASAYIKKILSIGSSQGSLIYPVESQDFNDLKIIISNSEFFIEVFNEFLNTEKNFCSQCKRFVDALKSLIDNININDLNVKENENAVLAIRLIDSIATLYAGLVKNSFEDIKLIQSEDEINNSIRKLKNIYFYQAHRNKIILMALSALLIDEWNNADHNTQFFINKYFCSLDKASTLSFQDYLIMPVQRAPRYELLFKEMAKYAESIFLISIQEKSKEDSCFINQSVEYIKSVRLLIGGENFIFFQQRLNDGLQKMIYIASSTLESQLLNSELQKVIYSKITTEEEIERIKSSNLELQSTIEKLHRLLNEKENLLQAVKLDSQDLLKKFTESEYKNKLLAQQISSLAEQVRILSGSITDVTSVLEIVPKSQSKIDNPPMIQQNNAANQIIADLQKYIEIRKAKKKQYYFWANISKPIGHSEKEKVESASKIIRNLSKTDNYLHEEIEELLTEELIAISEGKLKKLLAKYSYYPYISKILAEAKNMYAYKINAGAK